MLSPLPCDPGCCSYFYQSWAGEMNKRADVEGLSKQKDVSATIETETNGDFQMVRYRKQKNVVSNSHQDEGTNMQAEVQAGEILPAKPGDLKGKGIRAQKGTNMMKKERLKGLTLPAHS